jgi:hypothetical protein
LTVIRRPREVLDGRAFEGDGSFHADVIARYQACHAVDVRGIESTLRSSRVFKSAHVWW